MTPRSCAATVSLLGAIWGCAASNEKTGALASISPDVAYNDVPLDVQLGVPKEDYPFRPAYEFDTGEGATAAESGSYAVTLRSIDGVSDAMPVSVALQAVAWKSAYTLAATVPAGVPAGAYDVVVTDPRGETAKLSQAFTSLGSDEQPPAITVKTPEPGSIVGALRTIKVAVIANDGYGLVESMRLVVSAGSEPDLIMECHGTPAPQQTCELEFLPPVPADETAVVKVTATAIDVRGNEATAQSENRLVPRPVVISMTPAIGPTAGGTEIVFKGSDFIVPVDSSKGSDVLIDGMIIPDAIITPTEIRAVTVAHDEAPAIVQITNGLARSAPRAFRFVAPPNVRTVSPPSGPVAGGTWVAVAGNHFRDGVTEIWFGESRLDELTFVNANRIEGRVPAGAAVGAVDVTARDEIGGIGPSGSFTYLPGESTPPDPPDGGCDPLPCSGAQ